MEFEGRHLQVEIGEIAKQAAGACLIRYDDTVVLSDFKDRKSTRLNSSHPVSSRMPSSA